MSFKVLKSGFLASIQDAGRFAYGKHGISQSGVMDEHAYAWANYLLNNKFNDAVLEITFGSVVLKALDEMAIVLAGADLDFKVNNASMPSWQSIQINQGDILSWGNAKSGVRAYLAVKGGFDTATLFDSKSVNLREHIGKQISVDEILPCEKTHQPNSRSIDLQYLPDYQQELCLRILPSYQFNEFSINQRDLFFNQHYRISNANDRTGCRLNGAPMALKDKPRISEGMSYGSVEITTDGLPIILLKDAPTIGGYAKIGTVFSLDLAKLAQQQTNASIHFELINIKQAQKQRKQFNQFFTIFQ